jgi:hypothetical protein
LGEHGKNGPQKLMGSFNKNLLSLEVSIFFNKNLLSLEVSIGKPGLYVNEKLTKYGVC